MFNSRLCGICIVLQFCGFCFLTLFIDPFGIIIGQNIESSQQFIFGQFCQMPHIQQAVFVKLLHCGAVFRLTSGSFCNWNFIFWHDYGMNFRCFFIIIPSWSCMNGNPVTDSEFHLFAVNHIEGFELFIHLIDIPEWFPDKYCFTLR